MTIKFSDGIEIDTSGKLRKFKLHDGWYVSGKGFLIPVKDENEADKTIREMRNEND